MSIYIESSNQILYTVYERRPTVFCFLFTKTRAMANVFRSGAKYTKTRLNHKKNVLSDVIELK